MTTLVIILGQTRASELTFDSFKKNVVDELHADVCVCIGVTPEYDYTDPFYQIAKYRFTYNEPDDYGGAFEHIYGKVSTNTPEYFPTANDCKTPLYWREFLKLNDQLFGGIKSDKQHPGSGGILLFCRWFLLQNLLEHNLIDAYDKFIITRSDFIYQLPHPKVHLMDDYIWVPDEEHYDGLTDRHVILSKRTIMHYLNIVDNMILKSNQYFTKMKEYTSWNLERFIKFHLAEENVLHLVKEFPYVMYSVRNINGSTRWSEGNFSHCLGYFIKYDTEYKKSTYYKEKFETSGLTIDEFYKHLYIKIDEPLNQSYQSLKNPCVTRGFLG